MIKIRNIISIDKVFFFLLAFIIGLLSEQYLITNTSYQKVVWILLAIVGIVYIYLNRKESKWNDFFPLFILVPLPFVLFVINTFMLSIVKGDILGLRMKSASTMMFIVVDILMVAALLMKYKEKAVDFVFWCLFFSYSITIITALQNTGVSRLILYLTASDKYPDWYFSSSYERHDVGIAVVPLILYYLYLYVIKKTYVNEKIKLKIFVLLGIMYLSGKRSAFTAIILGIVVIWYLKKRSINKSNLVLFLSFIYAYLYVVIIHTNILSVISNAIGVNSMGRIEVWNYFSNQYSISPFYLGQGFQYVHVYMVHGLGTQLVNDFDYLHNSILQVYIENGFWCFFIWLSIILVFFPVFIKNKFGENSYLFYIVIVTSMLLAYSTDNVLTYPLYLISTYICVFSIAYIDDIRNITSLYKKMLYKTINHKQ